MDREIVERTILHDLYEAWFVRDRSNDMDMIRERNGWEDPSFWRIVDHMADAGHVRAVAIGGWYEITPNGIVLAENEGIAPEELTKTNQRARTLMLDSLATVYEQEGAWVHTYYQMLCEKTSLDAPTVVNNLQVLQELGYVDDEGGFGEKITRYGLAAVEGYRRRKTIAEEFERISEMSPQPRGRALQTLFARIVGNQNWSKEESVRTSHEEMDVIVHRDREYYLVECKWEKDSIEAGVIRELHGKLANRAGVRGMAVSMSGFTEGAVKQVQDYAGSQVILLFGPEDVRSLVYSKSTFEELLNLKSAELLMRKIVLVDGQANGA